MIQNITNKPPEGNTGAEKRFSDASALDKKIPENLLMKYQGAWFVLKSGLEYKAHLLYRGGKWGVLTDIIEKSPDYVLAKATFVYNGEALFSNYGEASKANVTNTMMHKYMLHLAVTRAECRVLRMATASAYTSAEEMDWYGNGNTKELPISEKDNEPASQAQLQTIKSLKGEPRESMTQAEARVMISELAK